MAQSVFSIVKSTVGDVTAAAPGKVKFFVDIADGFLKGRDEFDGLEIFAPSVGSALANVSVNPTILTGSLEPSVVGHLWVVDVIGPPHSAELVDPKAQLISTTVFQTRAPITAADTALLDELLLVDLDGAAGDVTVTLPAPVKDREVLVKIDSDGFPVNGRKVILAPAGGATVDGLGVGAGSFLELLTNREWRWLRGHRDGVNWIIVG